MVKKNVMIIIVLFLFIFKQTFQVNHPSHKSGIKEIYLSPWRSISKKQPKIIDFANNGEITTHNVPLKNLIPLKRFNPEYIFKISSFNINIRNTIVTVDSILEFINMTTGILNRSKPLKILTICRKNLELCRFVTCPMIQKNCILCEFQKKPEMKNVTTCELISTNFLVGN